MLWSMAAVACDTHFTTVELRNASNRAQAALDRLKVDAYEAQVSDIEAGIPCLTTPVTSDTAARIYFLHAARAHIRREPGELYSFMLAYRDLSERPPPAPLAPQGHPIHTAWVRAGTATPTRRELLPVPMQGHLLFDGVDSLERPTERPVIAQFLRADGSVEWSRMLLPSDPLTYEAGPESSRAAYETSVMIPGRPRPIGWLMATGGLTVLAGTAATLSGLNHAFNEPTCGTAGEELCEGVEVKRWRRQTNGLTSAAVGFGVGAIGAGVVTAWRW